MNDVTSTQGLDDVNFQFYHYILPFTNFILCWIELALHMNFKASKAVITLLTQ